jgi:hypothetical protein
MLRSRSVTGWPHHLDRRYAACQPAQGDLQNHPGLGQHQGGMLLRRAVLRPAIFIRGCGSTRKAPALQAVSCGSVTRHLHHFHGSCPGSPTVNRPSQNMPEVDGWSITTDSHHFITPARVPKPKSSRRTVVNRVINECESRRSRHG